MTRPNAQPLAGGSETRIAQVMAEVRARVANRSLGPGAQLPSIRACAAARGVSKSTVVEAYERLVAFGIVVARPGAGFYVAERAPAAKAEAAQPYAPELDPVAIMRSSLSFDAGLLKPGCGWLPHDWLPIESIRRGLRSAARGDDARLVQYAPAQGFMPLREQLSRRLYERGVGACPAQVLLLDSGTQALDLVARLLLRPDDVVLVDDPCYFNFIALARAHHARVVGVPMTPDGPDLVAFTAAVERHRPRLYLTTAALHNPTGASVLPALAHRLLTVAQANDVIIVEDDIFADLEPEPNTTRLAALDGLARVIQVGSFSKTLSAAVRCGFVAARTSWIEALIDLKLATQFAGDDVSAALVYGLLTDGSYRRHIDQLKARLTRARAHTVARARAHGMRLWTEARGGIFVWAELPDDLDSLEVARSALTQGVMLAPGAAFSVGNGHSSFLRLNVAQCADPRVFEVLDVAMAASR